MASSLSFLNVELSSSDEISSSSSSERRFDVSPKKSSSPSSSSSLSSAKTIFRELLSPPRVPPDIRLTLLDDLNAHCAFVPYQIVEDSVQIPIPEESNDRRRPLSCFDLFLRCFDSIFQDIVCLFDRVGQKRRRSSSSTYDFEQYSCFLSDDDPNVDIETGNLRSFESRKRCEEGVGRKRSISTSFKDFN